MIMELEAIYPKYSSPDKGGDKGTQHSYIPIYGKQIPSTATSLLEIGVYKGQSLQMWMEYLPEAIVVGLDVDLSLVKVDVDARKADATDLEQIGQALGDARFDYIIDDGSHRVHDQIASFDLLYRRVHPGGAYFIEDVAGPDALRVLMEALDQVGVSYQVWDMRAEKGRFDDILVMVPK